MHGTPPDPRTPAGSPDIRVAGPPKTPPAPKQDTPGPPRTAEPPRPGDEPRTHQGRERGGAPARPAARPMPAQAAAPGEHGRKRPRLLDEAEAGGFRDRWHVVQAAFVDDPADSARRAEELAAEVVNALGRAIADRKRVVDESARDGAGGEPPDTERLRQSLRAYRDLVDRLLAI
ncbi:hypothetical protein Acsp03_06080 [Actinomadura sp. NBRC 104412]|uniref:hypothetical protein n=1 Tax=Actinomadura sp. NBRC 104412 TaxID=3032203 RepID=UPI0024A04615|nr:hypothetical protein [Actinomadura sp. NBRC 104412]GLZ03141.1 hypothetical protein Acsp03_06080 [Actinomadura sp. NBRC 104412]